MATVGILGAGMVGSTWLRGIPWNEIGMRPLVYEPAEVDLQPFDRVADPSELRDCDLVLVFVSGGIADKVIRTAFGKYGEVGPREILDFTSNGPDGKKATAEWCNDHGSSYVDVTILGAIAAGGLKTPLAIAGTPSEAAGALINASGASQLKMEGAEAGAAARIKLVRSIVTKGLEVLACEAQIIADEFNMGPDYTRVFEDFDTGRFTTIMNSMVQTHPDHRERRGKEVRELLSMIGADGRQSALLDAVAKNYELGAFRPVE
ncbi:hypothetical protein [Citricoccus muralis]|uniref:3-hydroxyisobutyrate dehydrogenase-like beta-hydroxyacid dehydrogenase n=1 Tax=Citricoccus muralis TaxID=169134 RepID=A0ABY8H521_9MICC|nr:hypothetical protein [Citricoccus muralis]WFP16200.1 hypothetical protein P8192_12525 [Citricoccus muralis]